MVHSLSSLVPNISLYYPALGTEFLVGRLTSLMVSETKYSPVTVPVAVRSSTPACFLLTTVIISE